MKIKHLNLNDETFTLNVGNYPNYGCGISIPDSVAVWIHRSISSLIFSSASSVATTYNVKHCFYLCKINLSFTRSIRNILTVR